MGIADQFITSSSNAAVRKPTAEISMGGGGGALGGLADAAGLSGAQDPWLDRLVSIDIRQSLMPGVDTARIVIAPNADTPEVALNDEASVSLGYEDEGNEEVISGLVESLRYQTNGTRVLTLVSGAARLAKFRLNQSYDQQAAGDIVSDLCAQAEVETDTVESGIDLPYFVVDDRTNAMDVIYSLAKKCGYVCFFTSENALYFGPRDESQAVQSFNYGGDLISIQFSENNAAVENITVVGEGAAGAEGQDAWCWIIKDPAALKVEAGTGHHLRFYQDGSIRSGDAAQSSADGLLQHAGFTVFTGELCVPGAPLIKVGSNVEISSAPQEVLNGSFYVLGVHHHYSKKRGLISSVSFCRIVEAGLGGALGGLL